MKIDLRNLEFSVALQIMSFLYALKNKKQSFEVVSPYDLPETVTSLFSDSYSLEDGKREDKNSFITLWDMVFKKGVSCSPIPFNCTNEYEKDYICIIPTTKPLFERPRGRMRMMSKDSWLELAQVGRDYGYKIVAFGGKEGTTKDVVEQVGDESFFWDNPDTDINNFFIRQLQYMRNAKITIAAGGAGRIAFVFDVPGLTIDDGLIAVPPGYYEQMKANRITEFYGLRHLNMIYGACSSSYEDCLLAVVKNGLKKILAGETPDIEKHLRSPEPPKKKKKLRTVKHFARAMSRAIKTGFKKVTHPTYRERLICCTTCTEQVNKCPYCGCKLKGEKFSKAVFASEQGCPNPQTYPRLPKYPPRNFWSVCDDTTTALISCRNENPARLKKTINSIIANSTGKLEVIVLLDGKINPQISDNRVKIIRFDDPVGRRIAYNEGVKQATGDYLFFIDSHCTMTEGWDTKLKCACDRHTLAVSTIASLTADMEERKKGHYTYVALDDNLQDKWWGNKKDDSITPTIAKTMAFTGCGWMIRKDYFLQLGGFDISLGEYGHTGSEWSLKVQCGPIPGNLVLRTDVTCGHVFSTNTDSALYKASPISQDAFKKKMYEIYDQQSILRLVKAFAPVPGWSVKNKKPVIIRCTDGHAPQAVLDFCDATLIDIDIAKQVVTVRRSTDQKRCSLTYYKQLLQGLAETQAEYVFIGEHDVLYDKSHFDFIPPNLNTFYYNLNVWRLDQNGFFHSGKYLFSQLVVGRKLLYDTLTERIKVIEAGGRFNSGEFGFGFRDLLDNKAVGTYKSLVANVDIRHGQNHTRVQKGNYVREIPHWGRAQDLLSTLDVENW